MGRHTHEGTLSLTGTLRGLEIPACPYCGERTVRIGQRSRACKNRHVSYIILHPGPHGRSFPSHWEVVRRLPKDADNDAMWQQYTITTDAVP